MKALLLAMTVPVLGLAQAPVAVAGKDLPVVPGPLAGTRPLHDLAGGPGESGFELRIRRSSRRSGAVPAVAVPPGEVAVAHKIPDSAGWQAYRVEIAPGEQVRARVHAPREGWFAVRCVNRMGELGPGMLRNLLARGDPEATCDNAGRAAVTVFFVVDTRQTGMEGEAYTVTFTRKALARK